MRRRDFIRAIVGAVTAWPFALHAQQTDDKRRISILLPFAETDPEVQTWIATFVQALRELGWIDGSNIQIDTHWAGADVRRINQVAIELIDRKPHVIFANGPLAVASLKQITSTIPIVFVGVADPVGSGFVADLARPGGNITGFTLGEFTMSGKMPEILKQIAPQVTHLTVIYNPQQVPQVGRFAAVQMAAPTLGLQVSGASAANAEEIKHAIAKMEGESDRGVIILPSAVTITNRSLIIALLARYGCLQSMSFQFLSGTVAWSRMGPTGLCSFAKQPLTSIAFSEATSPPTSQSRTRRSSHSSSMSRRPRRSV